MRLLAAFFLLLGCAHAGNSLTHQEKARDLGREYFLELVKVDTFLSKVDWNDEGNVRSATAEIHVSLERAKAILDEYVAFRGGVRKEILPPAEASYLDAEAMIAKRVFFGLVATTFLQIGVDVTPVAEWIALVQGLQAARIGISFIAFTETERHGDGPLEDYEPGFFENILRRGKAARATEKLDKAFREAISGRAFANVSSQRLLKIASVTDAQALLEEFKTSLECSLLLTEEGREAGRKFKLLEKAGS